MARLGYQGEARALVAEWEQSDNFVDPLYPFLAYFGLREWDETFNWLRNAIDERSDFILRWLRMPGFFAELESDPRFQELIEYHEKQIRSP